MSAAPELALSGETFKGKPLYVTDFGRTSQASVFWNGKSRWIATNTYLNVLAETPEEAARLFRERWDEVHG